MNFKRTNTIILCTLWDFISVLLVNFINLLRYFRFFVFIKLFILSMSMYIKLNLLFDQLFLLILFFYLFFYLNKNFKDNSIKYNYLWNFYSCLFQLSNTSLFTTLNFLVLFILMLKKVENASPKTIAFWTPIVDKNSNNFNLKSQQFCTCIISL
ncbi:hypothetical protein STABA_v1c06130 [Spiroplasma tabanidicola]|uniref:Uncharacterized protein n=1 Tax=Spiroplasma tabanidicola TaxID=324079 RepID=A0A6I6C8H8_9MOLU|nr:hypothetical protein STABA_v1c06130 [Spiroplasma tabanidicola]